MNETQYIPYIVARSLLTFQTITSTKLSNDTVRRKKEIFARFATQGDNVSKTDINFLILG